MQRTGVRQYVARNQDGAEIRIGHGPGLFSPGDLLKLALAGCNAMSSDARMAARLGDDFEQFVGVSADYDQDNDRFTHVDVELVQDMSALSEEEIEDLKRRGCRDQAQLHDRAFGRRPGAVGLAHVDERADRLT